MPDYDAAIEQECERIYQLARRAARKADRADREEAPDA